MDFVVSLSSSGEVQESADFYHTYLEKTCRRAVNSMESLGSTATSECCLETICRAFGENDVKNWPCRLEVEKLGSECRTMHYGDEVSI